MNATRTLLLSTLVTSACGGAIAGEDTADPLPAELPYEFMSLTVTGPAVIESNDPLRYSATFADTALDENGGIYPVQYGIGYYHPTRGQARVELDRCREVVDELHTEECEGSLTLLELTVTARPDYPDEFMDGATFSLEAVARGTAERTFDGTFWLVFEDAVMLVETRMSGSQSRYEAGIGVLLADTMRIDGHLNK